MPTLGEFVTEALDNGCHLYDFPAELTGPLGTVKPKCMRGPRRIPVILPDVDDDEPLTPTVVRGLCRNLGISAKLFGFDLDG